jgi:hypothetical protein
MLLTMKAYSEAARALAFYAALQLDFARHHADEARRADAQARGDLLIPIVKAWSTDLGVQLTSIGVQVHGGMGFIEETGAAQFLRDARIGTIYEGTNGIQAADLVGRKIRRDDGVAMNALIADMRTELNDGQMRAAVDAGIWDATAEAIDLLGEATDALRQFLRAQPERALGVAAPYLTLCGVTIAGWMMAKAYALATRKLSQDSEFFRAKQQTTRFYAEHALPETMGLARIVKSGAPAVVEADPALM